MSRVKEIEAAVENLAPEEVSQIARWFRERDQSLWDQQLDIDSSVGKLDFLFEEASRESGELGVREWPASQ